MNLSRIASGISGISLLTRAMNSARNLQRLQVRLGKISVIVCVLFRTHHAGLSCSFRPTGASPDRTASPDSWAAICRSISYSIAFCMKRTELRFFSSTLLLNFVSPTCRTDTFASQRRFPFSMSASLARPTAARGGCDLHNRMPARACENPAP